MNLRSQRGYSLLEIGIGLIIITIFMIFSVTIIDATHQNYRLAEQKSIALSYAVKAIERELLLGDAVINIVDDPALTVVTEDTVERRVTVTNIPTNNMMVTTTLETLPPKNGRTYEDSSVKLLTATVEFYTKSNEPASKKEIQLQTLKIEK